MFTAVTTFLVSIVIACLTYEDVVTYCIVLSQHLLVFALYCHNSFLFFYIIVTPGTLWVTLDESNNATLSWQPPYIERRHGTILYYIVNCSAHWQGLRDEQTANTTFTNQTLELQPYTPYQCCVSAVNEVGRGTPSCLTFITHEAGIYWHMMYTFQ